MYINFFIGKICNFYLVYAYCSKIDLKFAPIIMLVFELLNGDVHGGDVAWNFLWYNEFLDSVDNGLSRRHTCLCRVLAPPVNIYH